jgi:hypothetical protein
LLSNIVNDGVLSSSIFSQEGDSIESFGLSSLDCEGFDSRSDHTFGWGNHVLVESHDERLHAREWLAFSVNSAGGTFDEFVTETRSVVVLNESRGLAGVVVAYATVTSFVPRIGFQRTNVSV